MENKEKTEQAHAYTPGLKIKETMTVTKLRRLPIHGEVLVDVGDEVNYSTVVARTMLTSDPEIINAAMQLNMDPEDVLKYYLKKEGDSIKKGERIAYFEALFGLLKKEVVSPIDGFIDNISETTGQIFLSPPPTPLELEAYIPGKVIEVMPNEGLVIRTNAAYIQGIIGISGEAHGKIEVIAERPDEILTPDKIKESHKGKILIGGSLITSEVLKKALKIGVSAVVTGGIRYTDLVDYLGEEIGVAITGEEGLRTTLIITEGFGKISMSQRSYELLKKFEGYMASVNGTTQIRAGVMRPEIIIPHEQSFNEEEEGISTGMTLGTTVRIIREPYFGAIGKVTDLPVELQQLESRSKVRVVNVNIENGETVTIPRANVEIVEE